MYTKRLLLQNLTNVCRATVLLALAACTSQPPVGSDPDEDGEAKADGVAGLHDVRCAGAPDAGPARGARHTHNQATLANPPNHRGIDLVANAADTRQVLAGVIAYGETNVALDDEDVDVFACRIGAWRPYGSARTDSTGRFSVTLTGDARLPIGMRDLYVSVAADRSGARFLALVADQARLAASDVDGTLTLSEGADAGGAHGIDVPIHSHTVETFRTLASRGFVPVYVTARSQRHMQRTRDWLAANGMPRGPLRLAPRSVASGDETVEYKTGALDALAGELELSLGIGNRATDIRAYHAAGLPGDRIFIKLPEFSSEVSGPISRGEAVGIDHYPGALADVH